MKYINLLWYQDDFTDITDLLFPIARAALLTGRLPIRNGFYTTNDHARNGMVSVVAIILSCI